MGTGDVVVGAWLTIMGLCLDVAIYLQGKFLMCLVDYDLASLERNY